MVLKGQGESYAFKVEMADHLFLIRYKKLKKYTVPRNYSFIHSSSQHILLSYYVPSTLEIKMGARKISPFPHEAGKYLKTSKKIKN